MLKPCLTLLFLLASAPAWATPVYSVDLTLEYRSYVYQDIHVWDETDDDVEFAFPHDAGTLVLADYRPVHRGVAVHDDRWLAMFGYAKPWWIDRVNYEGGDYGGFKVPDPRPVQTTALVEHDLERRRWTMFWGLVNQWEASLVWELHNEL